MTKLSLLLISTILCIINSYAYSALINKNIYSYDMAYIHNMDTNIPAERNIVWDEMHFVSSLQGLANRRSSHLYVNLVGGTNAEIDRYWFDKIRNKEGWIDKKNIKQIDNINTLIKTFRQYIKGLVVYDGNVPATSNVASTVAGVENLACVRYDKTPGSLFIQLVEDPNGPRLPTKIWLVNSDGTSKFNGKGMIPDTATPSTGSAKCDAYIWAKEKYLDTGRCNPRKMGYYLDAYWLKSAWGYAPQNSLANHDYFISQKAFFFDLSPWDDEAPVDDLNQPIGTDTETLKKILLSAYKQNKSKYMTHIGGFVPWERKYSNFQNAGGKHEVVSGEWRYAEIISCFNAFMDADAFAYNPMANASFFQHYPLKNRYEQKLPAITDLKQKGYIDKNGNVVSKVFVSIYMGDYDSAAWMYNTLPGIWNDPARGTVPLSWGFNPNLAERFAPGMEFTRDTKSENDVFVAGDCGAGYVNPGYLVEPRKWSGLPSGLIAWTEHCEKWYKKWGLSATGFIIDGNAPPMNSEVLDAYEKFSPNGISPLKISHIGLHGEMPWVQSDYLLNIGETPERMAPILIERCSQQKPDFLIFRSVLWSPSNVKKLMEQVKTNPNCKDVEFVDIYTLMLLTKQFHKMKQTASVINPDLWDIKSGAEITNHSRINKPCDIRDIIGGEYGSYEGKTVLFADKMNHDFKHFVEWKTKRLIKLESFRLYAAGDASTNKTGAGMREFNNFRLYAKINADENWILIYEFSPTHPYNHETGSPLSKLHTGILKEPVESRYFRAEFDQFDTDDLQGWGPRIIELDGFGKFVD